MTTYTIPVSQIDQFVKAIKALGKRATRLGAPEVVYQILEGSKRVESKTVNVTEIVEGESFPGRSNTYAVEVVDVQVSTTPVRFNGYSFVASSEIVDSPAGKTAVFHGIDTDRIPLRYRTLGTVCEHCQINRNRKNIYIVTNGSEFKQVGSSCLQDFLGSNSPENVASIFAFQSLINITLKDASDDCFERSYGMGSSVAIPYREALALAIRVFKGQGYISYNDSNDQFSKNFGKDTNSKIMREWDRDSDEIYPTTDDAAIDKLDAWIAAQDEGDFFRTVHAYREVDIVSMKGMGVIACLPMLMERQVAREIEANLNASSKYVGTVGERRVFEVTVVRVMTFEGDFGTSYITIARDAEGNVIKGKDLGAEQGETIKIKATIKEHTEYKGTKQTVVLRAKRVD